MLSHPWPYYHHRQLCGSPPPRPQGTWVWHSIANSTLPPILLQQPDRVDTCCTTSLEDEFSLRRRHRFWSRLFSRLACLLARAIRPLQLIENAAARLVFSSLTLHSSFACKIGSGPVYIQDMVQPYSACQRHSVSANRLAAPSRQGTPSHSTKSGLFAVLAPKWWNKLPIDIRPAECLHIFCRRQNYISSVYTLVKKMMI